MLLGHTTFSEQAFQDARLDAVHNIEFGAVMVENMLEDDTAEGITAFIEKRPPNWPQD